MAERSSAAPAICLEFVFDRLLPIKVQQVYGLGCGLRSPNETGGVQGERRRRR
jgi:hypothetical protein